MGFIINIVLVILVLGLLIFIHELGHFLVAKLSNVKVEAFSIGMGPKIFSKKRGETEYRLCLLPIGGYVSILGEVVDEESMSKADIDDPRNFQNKNVFVKIAILLAGVTFNLLTAVIIYYVFLSMSAFSFVYPSDVVGYEPTFGNKVEKVLGELYYSELSEDGNAIKEGWPEDGYIRAVGDSESDLKEIQTSREFSEFTKPRASERIYVEICDYIDKAKVCEVYPSDLSEEGKVGILLENNVIDLIEYRGWEKYAGGFVHSVNMLKLAGVHIGNIFNDASDSGDYTQAVNTLAGPVGLYFIVDYLKGLGILGILDLIANLSLTLFFMNLLPIPALDGGRIVLVIAERIMGSRFNKNIEAWLIRISFILLMLLMGAVLIKDFIYIDLLRDLFA